MTCGQNCFQKSLHPTGQLHHPPFQPVGYWGPTDTPTVALKTQLFVYMVLQLFHPKAKTYAKPTCKTNARSKKDFVYNFFQYIVFQYCSTSDICVQQASVVLWAI